MTIAVVSAIQAMDSEDVNGLTPIDTMPFAPVQSSVGVKVLRNADLPFPWIEGHSPR